MGQLEDQLRRVEEMNEEEQIQLAPHEDALEFFEKVMRNSNQPMQRRMIAAKERAQYLYPRQAAVATMSMTGEDFASMLDRAIERSGMGMKLIEHHPSEAAKSPDPIPPRGPSRQADGLFGSPDKRFRR